MHIFEDPKENEMHKTKTTLHEFDDWDEHYLKKPSTLRERKAEENHVHRISKLEFSPDMAKAPFTASSKVDEGDLASSALYHDNKVYDYENNTDELPVATETKSTKTTRGRPKKSK